MPNGEIRPEHIEVLEEIGSWMAEYGETIYGTRGGPFEPRPWGVSTQKEDKIYIHLLNWSDPALILPGISEKIVSATIFGTDENVKFKQDKDKIVLEFHAKHPSLVDLVIQLNL